MAEAEERVRSIDPGELLRSALEKIVFFECRVDQLEAELAAARGAAERARGDGAEARRREIEAAQALAAEKGGREAAEAQAAELGERVRLLEAERERLLGGLVERARVAGAPGADGAAAEEGGADLAGFIAELRAEIEALRAWRAAAEAQGVRVDAPAWPLPLGLRSRPAEPVATVANRFEAAGRVGLAAGDAARLAALLTTRSDRVLYERAMEEIAAPRADTRLRAIRTLEALGSKAAAPLLAAALGREPEAPVRVAILGALARFKEPFAAGLAERSLGDRAPEVRVAALDALAAVAEGTCGAHLARALAGDASPLVRRRAALLLGFAAGERAEAALAAAVGDADRGVARAAAVSLSARPSAGAQGALARALEHGEPSVRRAAAEAIGRFTGEAVDADAPAAERRKASRRIAERLAAMSGEEIRERVLEGTARATAALAPLPPEHVTLSPRAARGEGRGEARQPAAASRAAVATLDAPASPTPLDAAVLGELRASLRGLTEADLVRALGDGASPALRALAARGAAVLRGARWFTN
jgi:hypothetical protein